MIFKKKKTGILFSLFILLLSFCCMFAVVPNNANIVSADTPTQIFPETFSTEVILEVTAYTKDGVATPLNPSGENITIKNETTSASQTMTCFNYDWKDIKYFKIGIDVENWVPTGEIRYNFSVSYFPAGVDSNKVVKYDTLALLTAPIYPAEDDWAVAQTRDGVVKELYFFIDDNQTSYQEKVDNKELPMANADTVFADNDQGIDYALQGGYGTYVFTFNCNDKSTSASTAYELKPTSLASLSDVQLEVFETIVSSDSSISNAYKFTITEAYQYINRQYITWKLTGLGADGTKYVLLESDKTAENETALYQANAINNKGASFTLDTRVQGTWNIQVIIDDGKLDENGLAINRKIAYSDEVSTIKPFSTSTMIWIVTGVTVVAVAIVATIIIITIKKEKTW
jgi:hypothetical protein